MLLDANGAEIKVGSIVKLKNENDNFHLSKKGLTATVKDITEHVAIIDLSPPTTKTRSGLKNQPICNAYLGCLLVVVS